MLLRPRSLLVLISIVLMGAVVPVLAVPASAARALGTVLTLVGESRYAGVAAPLTLTLSQPDGQPVGGAAVAVERRTAGVWAVVGTVVTDAAGRAVLEQPLSRESDDNVFRASYAGDPTYAAAASSAVSVALVRRRGRVRLGGPRTVVDEQQSVLRVRWTTTFGEPVQGSVRLYRRSGPGRWRLEREIDTGVDGKAELLVSPRVDTQWRVRVPRNDWVEAATSRVLRLDNVPPRRPVRLPGGAPGPRVRVPDQARAVGAGANPTVSGIPDQVWRQMAGVTWHAGCPVGRSGLRLVRVNYWGYDGYRRRGEVVASTAAASHFAGALAEMYDRGFPIRSMYRVDRFGWSHRVRGGDDYASMAAGNTSGFNCRDVVGRPGVRSPHSWGRSLDVNTWENPFRSARGVVPNNWWQPRSHPLVAWRSRSHPVVRIMARHGLRWTYGLGDTQHFDLAGGHGRVLADPACGRGVCD